MRIAILATSLALSACATADQQASADLDRGLSALVGQPVQVAVARLGEPIGAAPLGTDIIYGWGHAFTSTEFGHTSGGFVAPADYQGGFFPPPRHTVQNECVIRMIVGDDGLIRDFDHKGNAKGCRAYADQLAGRALARAG